MTVTTESCPAAISAAEIAVVISVALTYEVARLLPFHWITEEERNPLPFTVSVKAELPATAEEGETEVRVGTGALTAKLTADEVPPPGAGFATVMFAVPVAAMSAAVIAAVSCVPYT